MASTFSRRALCRRHRPTTRLPDAFSTKDAMAIGTAGYTAMLSVFALEHGGLSPARGDVLVTGANGGAGSVTCFPVSACS